VNDAAPGGTLWIGAASGERISAAAPLLGLTLVRRAVLAGERAGFDRILVEEREPGELQKLLEGTSAAIVHPGGPVPPIGRGRLVVLSDRAVPQIAWLRSLRSASIEIGRCLVDGSAAAALELSDAGRAAEALVSRAAGTGAVETAASLLPPSLSPLPPESGRFEIATAGDLRGAERWLLAGLVKENEGFMSRHVERRLSLAVSRRLAATSCTPNAMTLVSVAVGLAGAAFFLSTRPAFEFAGALLFLLHSILDGCDGELARLKFSESRLGGILDFWGDNVVHSAVFAAIAVAWYRATGESWALPAGAAAIAGTLLSAAFVYRTTMTGPREGPLFTHATSGPPSPLSRAIDALARRDFIYVVVALSAFGKAHWFLAAAALGAPLYLLLLVGLASRRLGRSFS
jgi:phosphatidylglycerophosphate synthase